MINTDIGQLFARLIKTISQNLRAFDFLSQGEKKKICIGCRNILSL